MTLAACCVPALVGCIVAAFAVGLSAGEMARRRRGARVATGAERKPTAASETPAVGAPRPAADPQPTPMPARPPPPAPSERAPAIGVPEPAEAVGVPPQEPRRKPLDPAPVRPTGPAPAASPKPRLTARRFARAQLPWPEEAATTWTCEIDWKPGNIKSSFRAMAAAPGDARRTLVRAVRADQMDVMGDPEPPTEELVEVLRELVIALTDDGWVRIGPAGRWYRQRFLWAGEGQPRPLAPLKGKEANA